MPEEPCSGDAGTAQFLKSHFFSLSGQHSPLPPLTEVNLAPSQEVVRWREKEGRLLSQQESQSSLLFRLGDVGPHVV